MRLVPSRRWLAGLAVLALVGVAGFWWPSAGTVLLLLDLGWVALLLADGLAAPTPRALSVTREAPAAFSLGRTF
ncbi:MAG TPA: hypothetical protein VFJ92_06555, partial [Gemmatimonadales bacterium]|nr:hypothetical protein [Gemmatimonadales bacterium]